MITLQNLDLTDKDFDMIVEGLEALPHKGEAGEMMSDLMTTLLSDKKPHIEEFRRDQEMRAKKKKEAIRELIEDVRILQGKLITLKRYLKQEGALKEADGIINPK